MRKYYAEMAQWGRDNTLVIQFDSKKERDDFICMTDYSNAVYAWEIKKRDYVTYAELMKHLR